MTKLADKSAPQKASFDADNVDALASKVLSVLASKKTIGDGQISQDLVEQLALAVRQFDPQAQKDAMNAMLDAGISPAVLIDRYIPLAAEQLGEAWCEDTVSFADVTIGVARLQAMLRDVTGDFYADLVADSNAPSVLLVVLSDEYHTLGATIAANQLRRCGVSVRLKISVTEQDITNELTSSNFDLLMISASCGQRLELIRKIIDSAKRASHGRTPVALGGSVVNVDANLKALTGADVVTTDTAEALRQCALTIKDRAALSQSIREKT